jgi:hypothetical protein
MSHKSRNLRFIVALAILLTPLATFAISSAGDVRAQEELPEPSTTLRVMHAAEGSDAVDISVDGEAMFQQIRYGEVTPYSSVAPGEHEFSIDVGDGEDAPIVVTATIESGDAATVLLVNGESGLEVRTFEVNLDRTDTGEARIRMINASADVGELDFYGNDDRWFEDVGFPDASDYKDVGWGEYDLTIRHDDADQPIASMPAATLNWGNVYDVVMFGSQANDSLQSLTLVTTVSPRCTLLLDVQGPPAAACLRIANLAPSGLPLVDIYYNHVRILESVGLGDRLNYVSVPTYDYEVQIHIVPAGMGTDYSSTYRYVELRAGEAYDLFIVGSANSPAVVGGRVNLTPPPVGQGRWRIIQGYPDAASIDVVIKDGPVVFSDVSYKDATEYVVLDAGDYTFQILDHETGSVLFEEEATVAAGMVYDSVVSYSVEVTVAPEEATPVAITGQNAMIITFVSPTFPRGGVLVPGAQDAEPEASEAPAEATPEA